MIYLALYKGNRDGRGFAVWKARFCDWLTRKVTQGVYSHCEIAVSRDDGKFDCYSSSVRDGGVRMKTMPLPSEKWDLTALPSVSPDNLQAVFKTVEGMAYDWFGAVGVVLKTRQHPRKWFCSEFCAAVMGLADGWRFSPNDLAAVARRK